MLALHVVPGGKTFDTLKGLVDMLRLLTQLPHARPL